MNMHARPTPTARADRDGLAVIGRTLHELRGIRFEDGENGGAPAGQTPPAGQQQTPPAPAGQTPPAPTPPADPRVAELAAQQAAFTPEQTAAYILRLRNEAEQNRTAAQTAAQQAQTAEQQRNAVLAALGLSADGQQTPPDPAALERTLAERTAAAEQTARENLVLRVAGPLGANADRLLDSRSFLNKLSSIKVDDRTAVESAVTEALANDASLKVTSAASSSGGTTHTGTTPPTARRSMADAVGSRIATANR